MDVQIVAFSKRLYDFNISKDLSYFTVQNRRFFVGCLSDNSLLEVKKDNDIYLSTFSDDNSLVVIKDYKKLFFLSDNFKKNINIRRSTQSMYFSEEKPLVYKGFIYSFFNELLNGNNTISLYQIDKTKKRACWSSDNTVLSDSKIYNDCLYAVFSKTEQEKNKTQVLIYDLITEKNKFFDLPFSMGIFSAIIPQKKLIVSMYVHIDGASESYSVLKYYNFDTCEIVCEKKLNIMALTSLQLGVMCNGKYLVIPHTRGVMIFDNEEFLLKKEIRFTLPRFVNVCDNDNYCCVASYGDLIVFSLSESSENELLRKSLYECFEKNALGNFLEKE